MITSTIHSKARATRGFTLVEIMIGSVLGSMVLAAVLTTFLMLGRSGANAAAYSVMEAQSRRALEELSQDLRMASDVSWNSTTSITLLVPDNYISADLTQTNRVTYAYDSATKYFYRRPGSTTSTSPRTDLIKNVSSFTYSRFDRVDNPAMSNVTTKRIQLSMIVRTANVTVVGATNNILSASFILRNKPVN
jgi:prepilin-type N-terminal cleavage/methylation domain-containing protein